MYNDHSPPRSPLGPYSVRAQLSTPAPRQSAAHRQRCGAQGTSLVFVHLKVGIGVMADDGTCAAVLIHLERVDEPESICESVGVVLDVVLAAGSQS